MSEQPPTTGNQMTSEQQQAMYWKIGGVVLLCLVSGWIGYKYGLDAGAKVGFDVGARAGERVMDQAWRSATGR